MAQDNIKLLKTTKLTNAEREGLLKELRDTRVLGPFPPRGLPRTQVDSPLVLLSVQGKDGVEACHTAVPRDLSEAGAGILVGRFIWQDTPCALLLRTVDGGWHRVLGHVVRCTYLRDSIHEVAVQFNERIMLSNYVATEESRRNQALRSTASDDKSTEDEAA